MVKEIYSLGGFCFYSAKEVAEFKTQFPDEWESVKHMPLRLSGISMEECQDFLDYIDSLQNQPDICLAYRPDRGRGYGHYTSVWCNGHEVRGIFGYLESNNLKEHVLFEMVSLSKWKGMEIRTNYCR